LDDYKAFLLEEINSSIDFPPASTYTSSNRNASRAIERWDLAEIHR
jgi:hypothetical protein